MPTAARARFASIAPALALALAACSGSSATPPPGPDGGLAQAVTFADVAPIFNDKCVKCHQAKGIGPFRLDDYASAKARSALIAARVEAGTMPPFLVTHDGTCGDFDDA